MFYHHLDTNSVTDNKLFWKVIKPSFSDKAVSNENITLVENNENKICEIFNDFFSNIVSNLNIPETEAVLGNTFVCRLPTVEKILHSVGRQFFFFGRLFIEKK